MKKRASSLTRMERNRRIEIAVNVLMGIGCVVFLLVAAAVMLEIASAFELLDRTQETLVMAKEVNAQCEALLEEVAPWRK